MVLQWYLNWSKQKKEKEKHFWISFDFYAKFPYVNLKTVYPLGFRLTQHSKPMSQQNYILTPSLTIKLVANELNTSEH